MAASKAGVNVSKHTKTGRRERSVCMAKVAQKGVTTITVKAINWKAQIFVIIFA